MRGIPQPTNEWPLRRLYRGGIRVVFVALVVMSNAHCRLAAAEQVIASFRAGACHRLGQALPIGIPPNGCDNESGCMCRGATLMTVVDVDEVGELRDGNPNGFLVEDAVWSDAKFVLVLRGSEYRSGLGNFPKVITGRQRRALMASFLI